MATPELIKKAMGIWATALFPYPQHQQIALTLMDAITVSREHFDAYVLVLMQENEQLFVEAIALGRQAGILRTWADVETT